MTDSAKKDNGNKVDAIFAVDNDGDAGNDDLTSLRDFASLRDFVRATVMEVITPAFLDAIRSGTLPDPEVHPELEENELDNDGDGLNGLPVVPDWSNDERRERFDRRADLDENSLNIPSEGQSLGDEIRNTMNDADSIPNTVSGNVQAYQVISSSFATSPFATSPFADLEQTLSTLAPILTQLDNAIDSMENDDSEEKNPILKQIKDLVRKAADRSADRTAEKVVDKLIARMKESVASELFEKKKEPSKKRPGRKMRI